MTDKFLNLYKVVNKVTGEVSDFIDYENLNCIKDVKEKYDIYCLTMENCTSYIELKPSSFLFDGDYAKVYDMLILTKEEFLKSYSYIKEDDYLETLRDMMNMENMAEFFREAENLAQLEMETPNNEIEYMQEAGTDYISADNWKTAIVNFVNSLEQNYIDGFHECIDSMAC